MLHSPVPKASKGKQWQFLHWWARAPEHADVPSKYVVCLALLMCLALLRVLQLFGPLLSADVPNMMPQTRCAYTVCAIFVCVNYMMLQTGGGTLCPAYLSSHQRPVQYQAKLEERNHTAKQILCRGVTHRSTIPVSSSAACLSI